jgi:hypothetical protein
MEKWFDEVKNNSHRDQLSFNYSLWKCPEIKISYMKKDICDSNWFKWKAFHKKNKKISVKTGSTNSNVVKTAIKPKKTIEQLKKDFEKMMNKKNKIITNDIGIYKI